MSKEKEECRGCGNSWCQICKYLNITDKYTSFNNKKTFTTNRSSGCNNKSLIYKTFIRFII